MALTGSNTWRDAGRDNKLELIKQAHDRPPVLWVTTEILVHELHPAALEALEKAKTDPAITTAPLGTACPCCASRLCSIVERRPDLSVYIDRITGKRVRPERLTPEQRAKVEAVAERVHIPLRVSRKQLPLLFSDGGRKDLVSGGMRAGKSQVCLYAFAREWLLRGGRDVHLWLVAPRRVMAFELLRKVVFGDGTAPPVLPAVLFNSIPTSEHKTRAIMVDGTILSLRHLAAKRGTNLKSDAVAAVLVDEAAEMSDRDQLNAIEGRVHTTRGRLLLATTPTKQHWLRELVRDPCVAWDKMGAPEREENPTHVGRYWRYSSLGMVDNPWVDPVHTHREICAKGGEDDPAVQRDYLGLWSGSAGALWRTFSLTDHVLYHEHRDLQEWDEMKRRDITTSVARKLFGSANPAYRSLRASNLRHIGGMDVNLSPQSTVLLQVACDPDEPANRSRWTIVVHDVVQTFTGGPPGHADALHSKRFAKMLRRDSDGETYHGIGIVCDGTEINRPTRYSGDPRGVVAIFGSKGFDVRPPEYTKDRKPANPHRRDSYALLHSLLREKRIVINNRCRPLIDALLEQEDDGSGVTPVKVSHNRSDRISSSVEGLIYACWAIFHGGQTTVTLADGAGMLQ